MHVNVGTDGWTRLPCGAADTPVPLLSAAVSSLLSPLTPGTAPEGTGEGPAGATALGGRFPGTFTVTRSKSISFPWVFWV